ncbi:MULTISPECIES: hypothetical protein [unclassified Lentimonas]|uniref:hypothetical protein n=1 Tax=unclassified Lentimonas TaxID=2630993 RepID=UPI001322CCA4|nr:MULTISPECIES: hypothetical protein [unclassified Lentimonas]CAA6694113.1 Unannotated [Lentimonas sp. CC19]CAA6694388.1 Unannotated [Lentimonas sp. CC10]CAA7070346.1 Unannotated [Lentimonas sp. CC11]
MKWLPLFVALVLGCVLGFFLSPKKDLGSPRSTALEASLAQGGSVESMGATEVVATEMSDEELIPNSGISEAWLAALKSKSQFEQIGALHGRLQGLTAEDFPKLLDTLDDSNRATNWIMGNLIATKWAESDPQGMLTYLQSMPQQKRWGMQNLLFSAWAKSDVNAAYAAAQALTDSRMRNSATQAVVRTVASGDLPRAMDMLQQMDDRRQRSNAVQSIIQTLAAKDPQAALRFADEQTEQGQLRNAQYVYSQIFSQWAMKDGAGARQAALAMPDSQMKVQALSGAMQEWVAREPMEALEWLDSLPVDGSVYNSRKEVFRRLLNQDFDTAKVFIESEPDPVQRRDILSNLHFQSFAWNKSYEDIESLFDWVGTVTTGSTYDQKVGDVLRSMADADPDRAIEFARQMRPGSARMNALSSVASMLAERDPKAALTFAQSLEYEDERERALNHMSWQLSRNGGEEARALILESEDPMLQRKVASQMVGEWAKYDRAGALAWVESLSDEQARNNSVGQVLSHWIQSEPVEAIDYMVNDLPENRLNANLSSAYSQWARQDPEAAIAGLAQLPDSEKVREADIYNRIAQAYVQHDPMAASEWIATLDDGPARDASVKTLVSNISKTDPEAGFIWSETIADEKARKNSLRQTVQKWVKDDPDAAYDAVSDSRMPAAEKEPLLKLIEQAQQ